MLSSVPFRSQLILIIFDHPRSGVVCNFGRVRVSVCLSDDNFQKS